MTGREAPRRPSSSRLMSSEPTARIVGQIAKFFEDLLPVGSLPILEEADQSISMVEVVACGLSPAPILEDQEPHLVARNVDDPARSGHVDQPCQLKDLRTDGMADVIWQAAPRPLTTVAPRAEVLAERQDRSNDSERRSRISGVEDRGRIRDDLGPRSDPGHLELSHVRKLEESHAVPFTRDVALPVHPTKRAEGLPSLWPTSLVHDEFHSADLAHQPVETITTIGDRVVQHRTFAGRRQPRSRHPCVEVWAPLYKLRMPIAPVRSGTCQAF